MTARIWQRGGGDPVDAMWTCILAGPMALIGARFYSAATDAIRGVDSPPLDFSQGGLGIYGAILGGAGGDRRVLLARAAGRSARSSTAACPGWRSGRRSAAWATTSTRSCSAGRPRCPGASTSIRLPPARLPRPGHVPPGVPVRVAVGHHGVLPAPGAVAAAVGAVPPGRGRGHLPDPVRRRPDPDRGGPDRRHAHAGGHPVQPARVGVRDRDGAAVLAMLDRHRRSR